MGFDLQREKQWMKYFILRQNCSVFIIQIQIEMENPGKQNSSSTLSHSQEKDLKDLTSQDQEQPVGKNEGDHEFDMGSSNYINFMSRWQKEQRYELPASFKLIKIPDKSGVPITGEYQWFNFPILSYSCQQLGEIAVKILRSKGFESYCNLPTLQTLISSIATSYNNVSYHNFSHSFSLMHMLYQLIKLDPTFKNLYTDEQIGYSLIAALAHDMNHPGTNNAYEVKTMSQRAIQFQNQSVLEKMHVRQFFQLVKERDLDIFERSTDPQKMKQLIIQNIISTDISKHFKNLQKLKTLLSTPSTPQQPEKHFYMQQVFHACDIGNPCLTFQQYINWASLLTYEFHTQTLLEQEHQVEVTEMLRFKSIKGFYQGQMSFINYLVLPLWRELAGVWTGFRPLLGNIETNIQLLKIKADNSPND